MRNPNLEQFNQFWIDHFREDVPPLPTSPGDLSITQQEIMREKNPKLYQNLFRTKIDSGKLPVDLELRIRNSNLWVEDADRLRKYGWEYEAQRIELEKIKYEQQKINKEIEESRARQEQQQQKNEAWKNMSLLGRMAAEPLTQDQILRNRKRYGVGQ